MNAILAVDQEGGIGKDGKIPWKNVDEQLLFKKLTMGQVVVMGRKTYESIGKELPGRTSLVISSKPEYWHFTPSKAKLKLADDYPNTQWWIIGGKECLESFGFEVVEEVYLSIIKGKYNCDVKAPQPILDLLQYIQYFFYPEEEKHPYPTTRPLWAPSIYCMGTDFTTFRCTRVNKEEENYQAMIERVYLNGLDQSDRTGVGTRGVFGEQIRFSLENGRLPASTIRKASVSMIFQELMWFLNGHTDANLLAQKGVKIWLGNSSREALDKCGLHELKEGDCGPIYGFQWRHWGAKYKGCKEDYTGQGIDQLSNLVQQIKTNPTSRRLYLSGWNVGDLSEMCLPPCHVSYQFKVTEGKEGKELSCHMYQRSSDTLLAGMWNVTSASLFTILLAHSCGLVPKELIVSYGDLHIYKNHLKYVKELLIRASHQFPKLKILNHHENVWDYTADDLELGVYKYCPTIKLEMNV